MTRNYENENRIYKEKYGHLPNDEHELLQYILKNRKQSDRILKQVGEQIAKYKKMKWIELNFIMYKKQRPAARPRASRRRGFISMYVPRAREDGEWFLAFAKENNLPYIETPCILNMTVYEQIPESMSTVKKLLAEMGVIRPWKRTGDTDNYAKGIGDMIQWGMLKDDCLVIESTIKLKYSIKPRVVVQIKYMEKFPE